MHSVLKRYSKSDKDLRRVYLLEVLSQRTPFVIRDSFSYLNLTKGIWLYGAFCLIRKLTELTKAAKL